MKTVTMMKMKDDSKVLLIKFTYSPQTVSQVRCLPPGRKWQPEIKAWTCPPSIDALKQLKSWDFELDTEVLGWEKSFLKPVLDVKSVGKIKGLKGKLMPFQKFGVGFLENRNGRALIADEMGLGKTIQTLAWLQNNIKALPALVICPASVKGVWKQECEKWTNLHAEILSGTLPGIPHAADARDWISIINYDIIDNWKDIGKFYHTVVLDECFPYKTPIVTNKGILSIGEIVERKLPVKCLGYNFTKKRLYFYSVMQYNKKQKTKNLIKINCGDGITLTCTPNHKIWEEKNHEYKPAEKLQTGDTLQMVQEKSCQEKKAILQPFLCKLLENVQPRNKKETCNSIKKIQCKNQNRNKVCLVQKTFQKIQDIKEKILWLFLRSKMENEQSRNNKKDIFKKPKRKNQQSSYRNQKTGSLRTNEIPQSIIRSASTEKNACYKTTQRNTWIQKSWWQRIFDRTTNNAGRTNQRANGILCKHTTPAGEIINSYVTEELQNRYSTTQKNDSNRSRWWESSQSLQSKTRPEKRFSLTNVRVESIEILESGDNRTPPNGSKQNQFVYNLEIQEVHNYFANSILVSNCHKIKNRKIKRTKAVVQICKGKSHIIALSGTPIVNRPIEFFNALNILDRQSFGGFWDYAQKYCGAKHNGFGWDFSGSSKSEELHQLLSATVMIRRRKKDVLTELPEKRYSVIPISLDGQEAFYQATLRDTIGELKDGDSQLQKISAISKLRQAAVECKFENCCEWIDDFLESGRKLIIFVIHHKTTDLLMERYKDKALKLDGRTPQQVRMKIVGEFQTNDKVKIFIGNIQTAGTGITLTAASDVLFMELPWTPGDLEQASDRCHRIGQKEAVMINYAIAKGTLEEDMLELLRGKQKVLDKVLDGETDEDAGSIFDKLINKILK